MESVICIRPPADSDDAAGAVRVFQEFLQNYQSTLVSAEHYFEQIMEQVQPKYAQAYAPWQRSVKDLLHGVYMVSKKLPLRNPKALADALRLFTLDSAISMLHDICISCKMRVNSNWLNAFKDNMRVLGEAFRVLMRQRIIARVH